MVYYRRNAEHPWDFPDWETTRVWLDMLNELCNDAQAFGLSSETFRKRINQMFRKTLNRSV